MPTPGSRQPARVVRVVDGDTIIVAFHDRPDVQHRVRFLSIDTPETVDPRRPVACFGREAAAATERLVRGKSVLLEKDVTDRDRFNRLLRYVWLEDGRLVNAELVREGYATANTRPPDVKYRDLLFALERQARAERRGMFGRC